MQNQSNYIVYVDESGNPAPGTSNPDFPIFVLAFCIFKIDNYITQTVPAVQYLKFKYYGHDMVVLHEREIRKTKPPFDFNGNPQTRHNFLLDLTTLIDNTSFDVVAVAIHEKPNTRHNPYHLALLYGMERIFYFLQDRGESNKITHVVFESRGKKEDRDLELEFRRIMDATHIAGMPGALRMLFASKQANSSGMQLADMIARPIGNHLLHPEQRNRAWEIIESKLSVSGQGHYHGYGLQEV